MTTIDQLALKWIAPSKDKSFALESTLINKCMFVAKDVQNKIVGITFCEPRSFESAFVDRLTSRVKSMGTTDFRFEIYLPPFLKHRHESLFNEALKQTIVVSFTSFLSLNVRGGAAELRSRIRVVNVDDSPVLLKFLKHGLDATGFIDVVGQISKSTEAAQKISTLKPDAITMDIQMPQKNGVEVVREVLAKEHFPILMISSLSLEEGSLVFEALNAGAFDYIPKPKVEERQDFEAELVSKILLAIEGKKAHASLSQTRHRAPVAKLLSPASGFAPNLVWAIAASTGGTQALTQVFTSMPNHIPPTLIIQHIPAVFSKSFAESLNSLCPFTVKEAEHGEPLKENHVYVAPGGTQMRLDKSASGYKICITDDAPVNRFKPSVDYLFNHLATIKDLQFTAGILTGMGKDGSQGLLLMKKAGAHTFAQDEASSTVYGMPRAAFEVGATDEVCSLEQVATTMLNMSRAGAKKRKSAA